MLLKNQKVKKLKNKKTKNGHRLKYHVHLQNNGLYELFIQYVIQLSGSSVLSAVFVTLGTMFYQTFQTSIALDGTCMHSSW